MNLIDAIISPKSFKITDQLTGFYVWQKLAVKSVTPYMASETARSPIQIKDFTDASTSLSQFDSDSRAAKIIKPVRLAIKAMTDDQGTVEAIIGAVLDIESVFDVTSKEIIAENMAVLSVEIDQSESATSANVLKIEMVQIEKILKGQFLPKSKADISTYGIKLQDPSEQALSSAIDSVSALTEKISSAIG